jgi:hypothetical protein
MVRDFFSKLLSSEISSFVRISVTVASLYPEVVSAEYCLHDCRGAIVGLEGAIVGLEQVPIDAERDRARAVPEFHICAIEIHSARTRSSVAASARAAMRNLLPTLAWSGKAVHLSSSPRTGSREDSAGLGGASRLPGVPPHRCSVGLQGGTGSRRAR